MSVDRQMLERVLDNRATAWAGPAAAVPVLLAIIFFGTITFRVAQQRATFIEKILTPPRVERQEKLDFVEDLPSTRLTDSFAAPEEQPEERLEIPAPAVDDAPEIQPARDLDQADVAMSEMPDQQPRRDATSPTVEVPGSVLVDPQPRTLPARSHDESATLKRAATRRPSDGGGAAALAATGGGATTGPDRSGDITAEPGFDAPVVVRRGAGADDPGAGIARPASQEKLDLTGWILRNPAPLRPAIQEALGYSRLKADRTSIGSVVDQDGTLYQLFFLHRTENNLLRILVVVDDRAYRIDLPDFFLEANHVKTGAVSRGAPPADSFDPGPIIEVSLESVDAIPAEVPEIFQLVLGWLDIKGQE